MVELQELNRPLTTPAPSAQGALGTWSYQIRMNVHITIMPRTPGNCLNRKHAVMVELQELNRPLATPHSC
jgi:hypothetical protein